jgi:hypothetical protein
MTIVLLLFAAFALMVAMLVLTLGVNELERKSREMGELVRKRYTIANPRKSKSIPQERSSV